MLDGFSRLTYVDVIYAALAAFVITQVVLSFSRLKRNMARMRVQPGANREAERLAIIKQCRSMFPVGTVNFRGKVFTTGMRVRITTLQKRIIEGEIIGKNDKDILCIITGQHIIAHELNKIEDMTELAGDIN
ncbi:hypothetical protein MUJ63_06315 [Lachnospiraceae bacterium NSJ-143]|nr:hypothetical protein [Lachnospiraceae bacterium NSJ-143]